MVSPCSYSKTARIKFAIEHVQKDIGFCRYELFLEELRFSLCGSNSRSFVLRKPDEDYQPGWVNRPMWQKVPCSEAELRIDLVNLEILPSEYIACFI